MDNQMEGSKMDREMLTAILKDDGVIWDKDLLCMLFGCDVEKCERQDECTVDWTTVLENNTKPSTQLVCH